MQLWNNLNHIYCLDNTNYSFIICSQIVMSNTINLTGFLNPKPLELINFMANYNSKTASIQLSVYQTNLVPENQLNIFQKSPGNH